MKEIAARNVSNKAGLILFNISVQMQGFVMKQTSRTTRKVDIYIKVSCTVINMHGKVVMDFLSQNFVTLIKIYVS